MIRNFQFPLKKKMILKGVSRLLRGVLRVFEGCCRVFEGCLKKINRGMKSVRPHPPVYEKIHKKKLIWRMMASLNGQLSRGWRGPWWVLRAEFMSSLHLTRARVAVSTSTCSRCALLHLFMSGTQGYLHALLDSMWWRLLVWQVRKV